MKNHIQAHLLSALIGVLCAAELPAQSTAFTYQGRFIENGAPFTGVVEFQFTLWDAEAFGNQMAATVPEDTLVSITNGLFTVSMDFGSAAFDGSDRWLEIKAHTSIGAFTTLTPRQPMTPTPYALRALSVSSDGLSGGTYTSAVTFANPLNHFNGEFFGAYAGKFSGNGTGVTNVNAKTLEGLNASGFWRVGGNVGTTPGADFLGTADDQPFEIKVNNLRALRFEDNGDSSEDVDTIPDGAPNVIGGSPANIVAAGTVGATIAGGGATNWSGTATINAVLASYGSVLGGIGNTAGGVASVAMGRATSASGQSSIAMGDGTTASGYSSTAMGYNTTATGAYSTAMGRETSSEADHATAMGHFTTASGEYSTAMGSGTTASGLYSTSMGRDTTASGLYSTSMGRDTTASGVFSTAMGFGSTASGAYSTATGYSSTASGSYSTAMGRFSQATNNFTFAAGHEAFANHHGSFVWSDGAGTDTLSTGDNSVTMRARGGFQFLTGPGSTGAQLAAGATSWSILSDRNRKKDVQPLDGRAVLDKLVEVPISTWHYDFESSEETPHIGPMAQDFKAAFYPGRDDTSISTLEADGVALAAIQGLYQKLEQKNARIANLEQRLADLEQAISILTSQSNQLMNRKRDIK